MQCFKKPRAPERLPSDAKCDECVDGVCQYKFVAPSGTVYENRIDALKNGEQTIKLTYIPTQKTDSLSSILYNIFSLETDYQFQSDEHPLRLCKEWIDLKQNIAKHVKETRNELIKKANPANTTWQVDYKPALDEFMNRTNWVQQRKYWPKSVGVLGVHRAHTISQYVNYLEFTLVGILSKAQKCPPEFQMSAFQEIAESIKDALGEEVVRSRRLQDCGLFPNTENQENSK